MLQDQTKPNEAQSAIGAILIKTQESMVKRATPTIPWECGPEEEAVPTDTPEGHKPKPSESHGNTHKCASEFPPMA